MAMVMVSWNSSSHAAASTNAVLPGNRNPIHASSRSPRRAQRLDRVGVDAGPVGGAGQQKPAATVTTNPRHFVRMPDDAGHLAIHCGAYPHSATPDVL